MCHSSRVMWLHIDDPRPDFNEELIVRHVSL